MAADWFRSPAWDEAARADFEARLARARPHNRQQYLRIKGVSLRCAGRTDAAVELLRRAADYPERDGYLHQTVAAWESLADIAAERGDVVTAGELYRRILALPNQSGSTGAIEISLADLLLDTGRPADRDEASALLTAWMNRTQMKFNRELFRWHMVRIRVAEAVGDREAVRRCANTALSLAERGPQLPRHPDVGVVQADKATLERLRELAN